jgi:Polysaccharide lyase
MERRLALRPLIALVIFGILSAARASAQVTFLGDWSDFGTQFQLDGPHTRQMNGQPVEWVGGSGANHWRMVQEKGMDRLQMEQDPTSPKGGAVLRVQVLSGDNVGWTGERAEVSHMLGSDGKGIGVTPDTGHEVYGVAVKVDPYWQPPAHSWHWGLALQLHSPDEFESPPAFALAVEQDFHINTCAGDIVDGVAAHGKSLPLTRGGLVPGHWVQFLIDVVWANDSTGSLIVYRRDEGEATFTQVLKQTGQATLQFRSTTPNPNAKHYWKMGYYRSVSPGVTSRLWLGPLARGSSLQEVAIAAFGRP